MPRCRILAFYFFLGLNLCPSLAKVAGESRAFAYADGSQFIVDGVPFRVAGVNNHYLLFGSDEEVRRVLDAAVAMHANCVRTFLGPVIGAPDGSTPTIWNWKSADNSSNLGTHGRYEVYWDSEKQAMAYNDGPDGLARLDFVLNEASRRRLKVIVTLLDFWSYTGGAQQMSAWYGSHDKYTFFARDPRTRKNYRDWVEHVITRTNALSGIAYRLDPTIFAWELMNEPDIQPKVLLMDWLTEMSTFVKSLDPAHMVSSGHGNIVNKLADLAIPTIDFGTWHGYAAYEHKSVSEFEPLIGDFCDAAHKQNKPVILEEFGIAGTDASRLAAFQTWSDFIRRDKDCAGWMVWRLVSKQDGGAFPEDHDGFDIRDDGGELWSGMKGLADAMQAPLLDGKGD